MYSNKEYVMQFKNFNLKKFKKTFFSKKTFKLIKHFTFFPYFKD